MALYFQHGITLNHIHDTQAAHSLNKSKNKQISYINLSSFYGFSVSKISKGKNNIYKKRPKFWEERPLTEKMIALASEDVKFSLVILEKQAKQMTREDLMLFQKACQKEIQFLIRKRFDIDTKNKLLKLPEIIEIERNQLKELNYRKEIIREKESTMEALTATLPRKKKSKNKQNLKKKPKWKINYEEKINRIKQNMQLQVSTEDFNNSGELEGITSDDIEMFKIELEEQHRVKMIEVNLAIECLKKQIKKLQNQLVGITNEENKLNLPCADEIIFLT